MTPITEPARGHGVHHVSINPEMSIDHYHMEVVAKRVMFFDKFHK